MNNKYPRIALYGNIANIFYTIGKALRSSSEIDVHLYLESDTDLVQSPESEDPELKYGYPNWIHKDKSWNLRSAFYFWRKNIVKELNKFDLIILAGRGVVLSPLLYKKTAFYVTGSDLTLIPFYNRVMLIYPTSVVKAIIGQILQRIGIKFVNEIWTQPFSPFKSALNRLNVSDKKIIDKYFPLIIDSTLFSYDANSFKSGDSNIRMILDNFKFVVFHPSRIMINSHEDLREAGQWKQNDLLFKAFADLVIKHGARDAVLVMPDREVSPDIIIAKRIIHELGIERNVIWIKGDNDYGFARNDLIKFYSIADVVADDFGIGWFGAVVLEGFAVGKPVLSYVDEEVMSILYPWHPVLSSNTREGNFQLLKKLYDNPHLKRKLGLEGRKWIEQFHSTESASRLYIEQFENINK